MVLVLNLLLVLFVFVAGVDVWCCCRCCVLLLVVDWCCLLFGWCCVASVFAVCVR